MDTFPIRGHLVPDSCLWETEHLWLPGPEGGRERGGEERGGRKEGGREGGIDDVHVMYMYMQCVCTCAICTTIRTVHITNRQRT